jgi:hypothetical protein
MSDRIGVGGPVAIVGDVRSPAESPRVAWRADAGVAVAVVMRTVHGAVYPSRHPIWPGWCE